jgi:hypothetical protein
MGSIKKSIKRLGMRKGAGLECLKISSVYNQR